MKTRARKIRALFILENSQLQKLLTADNQPLGYSGWPPEASAMDRAEAILFFSGDQSKAVSGQVLAVDHGCTL